MTLLFTTLLWLQLALAVTSPGYCEGDKDSAISTENGFSINIYRYPLDNNQASQANPEYFLTGYKNWGSYPNGHITDPSEVTMTGDWDFSLFNWGETGSVYGVSVPPSNLTLEYTGFYRPDSSGTYSFSLAASGPFSIQIGRSLACCRSFDNSVTDIIYMAKKIGDMWYLNYRVSLTENQYYPVKVVYTQISGTASFRWNVYDPFSLPEQPNTHIFQMTYQTECPSHTLEDPTLPSDVPTLPSPTYCPSFKIDENLVSSGFNLEYFSYPQNDPAVSSDGINFFLNGYKIWGTSNNDNLLANLLDISFNTTLSLDVPFLQPIMDTINNILGIQTNEPPSNITLVYSGYYYAHETGDHTFRIIANGPFSLQLGSSITCCQSFDQGITNDIHLAQYSGNNFELAYKFPLVSNHYYPIKVVYTQKDGDSAFWYGAYTPSGTLDPISSSIKQIQYPAGCVVPETLSPAPDSCPGGKSPADESSIGFAQTYYTYPTEDPTASGSDGSYFLNGYKYWGEVSGGTSLPNLLDISFNVSVGLKDDFLDPLDDILDAVFGDESDSSSNQKTTPSNFTVEFTGYYYSQEAGNHMFNLTANGPFSIQVGRAAGCCKSLEQSVTSNVQIAQNYSGLYQIRYNVPMSANQFYPIKIVYTQVEGSPGLSYEVESPSGTVVPIASSIFQVDYPENCISPFSSSYPLSSASATKSIETSSIPISSFTSSGLFHSSGRSKPTSQSYSVASGPSSSYLFSKSAVVESSISRNASSTLTPSPKPSIFQTGTVSESYSATSLNSSKPFNATAGASTQVSLSGIDTTTATTSSSHVPDSTSSYSITANSTSSSGSQGSATTTNSSISSVATPMQRSSALESFSSSDSSSNTRSQSVSTTSINSDATVSKSENTPINSNDFNDSSFGTRTAISRTSSIDSIVTANSSVITSTDSTPTKPYLASSSAVPTYSMVSVGTLTNSDSGSDGSSAINSDNSSNTVIDTSAILASSVTNIVTSLNNASASSYSVATKPSSSGVKSSVILTPNLNSSAIFTRSGSGSNSYSAAGRSSAAVPTSSVKSFTSVSEISGALYSSSNQGSYISSSAISSSLSSIPTVYTSSTDSTYYTVIGPSSGFSADPAFSSQSAASSSPTANASSSGISFSAITTFNVNTVTPSTNSSANSSYSTDGSGSGIGSSIPTSNVNSMSMVITSGRASYDFSAITRDSSSEIRSLTIYSSSKSMDSGATVTNRGSIANITSGHYGSNSNIIWSTISTSSKNRAATATSNITSSLSTASVISLGITSSVIPTFTMNNVATETNITARISYATEFSSSGTRSSTFPTSHRNSVATGDDDAANGSYTDNISNAGITSSSIIPSVNSVSSLASKNRVSHYSSANFGGSGTILSTSYTTDLNTSYIAKDSSSGIKCSISTSSFNTVPNITKSPMASSTTTNESTSSISSSLHVTSSKMSIATATSSAANSMHSTNGSILGVSSSAVFNSRVNSIATATYSAGKNSSTGSISSLGVASSTIPTSNVGNESMRSGDSTSYNSPNTTDNFTSNIRSSTVYASSENANSVATVASETTSGSNASSTLESSSSINLSDIPISSKTNAAAANTKEADSSSAVFSPGVSPTITPSTIPMSSVNNIGSVTSTGRTAQNFSASGSSSSGLSTIYTSSLANSSSYIAGTSSFGTIYSFISPSNADTVPADNKSAANGLSSVSGLNSGITLTIPASNNAAVSTISSSAKSLSSVHITSPGVKSSAISTSSMSSMTAVTKSASTTPVSNENNVSSMTSSGSNSYDLSANTGDSSSGISSLKTFTPSASTYSTITVNSSGSSTIYASDSNRSSIRVNLSSISTSDVSNNYPLTRNGSLSHGISGTNSNFSPRISSATSSAFPASPTNATAIATVGKSNLIHSITTSGDTIATFTSGTSYSGSTSSMSSTIIGDNISASAISFSTMSNGVTASYRDGASVSATGGKSGSTFTPDTTNNSSPESTYSATTLTNSARSFSSASGINHGNESIQVSYTATTQPTFSSDMPGSATATFFPVPSISSTETAKSGTVASIMTTNDHVTIDDNVTTVASATSITYNRTTVTISFNDTPISTTTTLAPVSTTSSTEAGKSGIVVSTVSITDPFITDGHAVTVVTATPITYTWTTETISTNGTPITTATTLVPVSLSSTLSSARANESETITTETPHDPAATDGRETTVASVTPVTHASSTKTITFNDTLISTTTKVMPMFTTFSTEAVKSGITVSTVTTNDTFTMKGSDNTIATTIPVTHSWTTATTSSNSTLTSTPTTGSTIPSNEAGMSGIVVSTVTITDPFITDGQAVTVVTATPITYTWTTETISSNGKPITTATTLVPVSISSTGSDRSGMISAMTASEPVTIDRGTTAITIATPITYNWTTETVSFNSTPVSTSTALVPASPTSSITEAIESGSTAVAVSNKFSVISDVPLTSMGFSVFATSTSVTSTNSSNVITETTLVPAASSTEAGKSGIVNSANEDTTSSGHFTTMSAISYDTSTRTIETISSNGIPSSTGISNSIALTNDYASRTVFSTMSTSVTSDSDGDLTSVVTTTPVTYAWTTEAIFSDTSSSFTTTDKTGIVVSTVFINTSGSLVNHVATSTPVAYSRTNEIVSSRGTPINSMTSLDSLHPTVSASVDGLYSITGFTTPERSGVYSPPGTSNPYTGSTSLVSSHATNSLPSSYGTLHSYLPTAPYSNGTLISTRKPISTPTTTSPSEGSELVYGSTTSGSTDLISRTRSDSIVSMSSGSSSSSVSMLGPDSYTVTPVAGSIASSSSSVGIEATGFSSLTGSGLVFPGGSSHPDSGNGLTGSTFSSSSIISAAGSNGSNEFALGIYSSGSNRPKGESGSGDSTPSSTSMTLLSLSSSPGTSTATASSRASDNIPVPTGVSVAPFATPLRITANKAVGMGSNKFYLAFASLLVLVF